MNPAGRSAGRGHCCSEVFRGSPRIWRGGQRRPSNSERARSRPFNDEVQPLAEAAETWGGPFGVQSTTSGHFFRVTRFGSYRRKKREQRHLTAARGRLLI